MSEAIGSCNIEILFGDGISPDTLENIGNAVFAMLKCVIKSRLTGTNDFGNDNSIWDAGIIVGRSASKVPKICCTGLQPSEHASFAFR